MRNKVITLYVKEKTMKKKRKYNQHSNGVNENSDPQMNQNKSNSHGFVHHATSPFTPYSKKNSIFSPGGLNTDNEKKLFDAFDVHGYLGDLRGFNEASPVLSVSNVTSPNSSDFTTRAQASMQSYSIPSFGSEEKKSMLYSFDDFASSRSTLFSHGLDAEACITLGNEWENHQAFDCNDLDLSNGSLNSNMSFDGVGFTPEKSTK